MIKEDYISFETAKLLKEKGFVGSGDIGSRCGFYSEKDYETGHGIITKTGREVGLVYDDLDNSELERYEYLRPTLQMAMKWLREDKNVDIEISVYSKGFDGTLTYCADILLYGSRLIVKQPIIGKTYEKTCEKAIQYALKNVLSL